MPHRVVIIGAGFGGIGMAIRLKRAGIEDFVVLDQADDFGGIWRDNLAAYRVLPERLVAGEGTAA